ncbi:MAG: hypothetical protein KY429_01525 [Actinobacteria bacterium]|nr:hypothetical protein [Actinomycetota bacterium]
MSTTALFAELLVVGIGALSWIALIAIALFGPESFDTKLLSSPLVLLGLLTAGYMAGIVIDRISDALLKPVAARIRSSHYAETIEFQNDREFVYQRSAMKPSFEYGRSRLRIARGWAVNSSLITLSGLLAVLTQASQEECLKLALLVSVAGVSLVVGNLFAWANLVKSEAENIRTRADALRESASPE